MHAALRSLAVRTVPYAYAIIMATSKSSSKVGELSRRPSVLEGLASTIEAMARSTSPNALRTSPPYTQKQCQIAEVVSVGNGSEWEQGKRKEIEQWGSEEVSSWLKETGHEQYHDLFVAHAINTGCILLSLSEQHLREMGIVKIGHRLEILKHLDKLRSKVGLVSMEGIVDIEQLVHQIDMTRAHSHLENYPKRIIFVRHAESSGNVDKSLYASTPDSQLKITEKGRRQALEAGEKLKAMIGSESISFYVSPFVRSKETYEYIRKHFDDQQVLWYNEDPRLREQEWGNFQDPDVMEEVMRERRKIGAFYYRFPTGESGADVYDRVSTFLETLYRDMTKGYCGQNAILISHGLFCRLFLMRFYHWRVEKFHKLWNFENCQYAVMELEMPKGTYKLVTDLKTD